MRRARRGHVLALVAALALGGLASVGAAGVAGGSASGACATAAGITVVVDFGSAGGGLQVGCASPPVANGFAALSGAGFPIRNVSSQPGFLCQIDGKPADDPCIQVPSSAHYWSYWYAQRGGDWTYSSSGASRTPPPGSVEGWAYGDGDPPRTPPPALLAAATTTTTTRATSPPVPSTVTTVPSATAGGVSSSTVGDDGSTAVTVDGEGTTTSTGTDRDAGASVERDDEQAADLVTTAARDDDVSGSPAGTVVGIAAVLGLVGAGAVTARHRRRTHAAGGE
jgi:hypothetical protein